MELKKMFDKLKSQGRVINNSIIGLTIFEVIITILLSIVSNKLTENYDIYFYSLIFLAFLLVAIFVIKIAYSTNFTNTIANELEATIELKLCKENAKRQEQITNYYIQSMKNLNGGTCSLDSDVSNLCDSGISDGVSDLIKPALDNMSYILNNINSNAYTVGIYLKLSNSFLKDAFISSEQVIYILKDDLKKSNILQSDMMHSTNLNGEALSIQSILRESINNSKFLKQEYSVSDKEYTIICSPMPYACAEDDLLGIIFIISDKLNSIPNDIPNTLTIFNRIISNWIYRFEACISDKYQELENRKKQNS